MTTTSASKKAVEEEDLDEEGYGREYPYYTAEVVQDVPTKPGCWNYLDIAVLEHASKDESPRRIGETYRRNYSTMYRTFAATRKGDRHFALYSNDYTSTRVMEIFPGQGWKDIGGEERDGNGFCPVELFIPTVHHYVREEDVHPTARIKDWSRVLDYYPPGSRFISLGRREGEEKLRYPDGKCIRAYRGVINHKEERYDWVWGPKKQYESAWIIDSPDHGFVAGCHWGDDSDWKIQYLDLSRIEEGVIQREERFGYVVLPPKMQLKDAISTEDLDEDEPVIQMAVDLRFDLKTGDALVSDNALWKKMLAGRKTYEERDGRWDGYRKEWAAAEEELKRRWKEEGARITAEVLASGGRFS